MSGGEESLIAEIEIGHEKGCLSRTTASSVFEPGVAEELEAPGEKGRLASALRVNNR